jgi:hypothetical protein
MLKKVLLFSFLSILFIPILVLAHQPRLAESNFIEVQNPEISQAFYGELRGEPVYYKIESSEPFNLYVGILVPDVPNIDKDVSAEIYIEKDGQKELLALLDGLNHDWPAYYEEFAGDDYFWGPEFEAQNADGFTPKGRKVEAGVYLVKVFSPDNQGKYVFVVGEKEEFPAGEIINTIKVLPKLKSDFFGKSAWSAFFNRIGLFLIIPLAIIVAVLVLIIIVIKKLSKVKKE